MARAELKTAILGVLGPNPLRLAEIAAAVGRPARDGSMRRALAELVEEQAARRGATGYTRLAPDGTSPVRAGTLAPSGVAGAVPGLAPVPPAHLGDAGRAAWELAWDQDWTDQPDGAQIAHLARLEDEAAALATVVQEQGITAKRPIVTPKGDVVGEEFVVHPAVAELRKLDSQLLALRSSLGLDPMSRARAQLRAIDEPDAIDELRQRRRERQARIAEARP
jgi:hypothetical protein